MIGYPAASGPHLRIENSIKALSSVCDLHLISRVPLRLLGGEAGSVFYKQWANQVLFSPSVHNLSTITWIRRGQRLARKFWVNDARFLVQYARAHRIEAIWFGFGNLSFELIKQVRNLSKDLPLIFDTDSVWSRFIARELPFIRDPKTQRQQVQATLKTEYAEKAAVQMCNVTTAVSEVDAEYYRHLTPFKEKVRLFSNVIDLAKYSEVVPPLLPMKHPALYLAGSFGKPTSAMNRAANWLLEGILPLVKKAIPDIHCYILGNHSDISFSHIKDPHVTVLGKVDCVLPYLQHVDVAVTPLQFESGTRFKILEAAACKVPMVSTTLGAEGLPVKDKEHLLIADDTHSFAQAIILLLKERIFARQIAENSFQLVSQQFGIENLKKEAQVILESIASMTPWVESTGMRNR